MTTNEFSPPVEQPKPEKVEMIGVFAMDTPESPKTVDAPLIAALYESEQDAHGGAALNGITGYGLRTLSFDGKKQAAAWVGHWQSHLEKVQRFIVTDEDGRLKVAELFTSHDYAVRRAQDSGFADSEFMVVPIAFEGPRAKTKAADWLEEQMESNPHLRFADEAPQHQRIEDRRRQAINAAAQQSEVTGEYFEEPENSMLDDLNGRDLGSPAIRATCDIIEEMARRVLVERRRNDNLAYLNSLNIEQLNENNDRLTEENQRFFNKSEYAADAVSVAIAALEKLGHSDVALKLRQYLAAKRVHMKDEDAIRSTMLLGILGSLESDA